MKRKRRKYLALNGIDGSQLRTPRITEASIGAKVYLDVVQPLGPGRESVDVHADYVWVTPDGPIPRRSARRRMKVHAALRDEIQSVLVARKMEGP
jgi:hypothetical protein